MGDNEIRSVSDAILIETDECSLNAVRPSLTNDYMFLRIARWFVEDSAIFFECDGACI